MSAVRRSWSSMLVVALALAMLVQFVVQQRNDAQVASCRAQFVAALPGYLDARGRLAVESDRNQNGLILGVAHLISAPPPATRAAAAKANATYRKLFADFTAAAADLDAAKAATQAPRLPDCF